MKKLLFRLEFSTYLDVFFIKFLLGSLVGWGIQLCIQGVPNFHIFDRPCSTKNKKYMKNMMVMSKSHFFIYFLFLMERCPPKVCQVGTDWMGNGIPHPCSQLLNGILNMGYAKHYKWLEVI